MFTNTYEIADIFSWLWIHDWGCATRINRLNNVIIEFYNRTYKLHSNMLGDAWSYWENQTINTTKPIYCIWGFFWKTADPIATRVPNPRDKKPYVNLNFKLAYDTNRVNTFIISGESEVTTNFIQEDYDTEAVPSEMLYSQRWETLSADETEIELHPNNYHGFTMLLQKSYAEKIKDLNSAQYWERQFQWWLESELEKQDKSQRLTMITTSTPYYI